MQRDVCVSLETVQTVTGRRLGQSARCSMSRRIGGDAFWSEFRQRVRPYRSIYSCNDERKASDEPKLDLGGSVLSLFADVRFRVAGWRTGEGGRLNDAPLFACFPALHRRPSLLSCDIINGPDYRLFEVVSDSMSTRSIHPPSRPGHQNPSEGVH